MQTKNNFLVSNPDVLKQKSFADLEFFVEHFKYKFLIYNDGNTLSDRTRLLLNVNSVIVQH